MSKTTISNKKKTCIIHWWYYRSIRFVHDGFVIRVRVHLRSLRVALENISRKWTLRWEWPFERTVAIVWELSFYRSSLYGNRVMEQRTEEIYRRSVIFEIRMSFVFWGLWRGSKRVVQGSDVWFNAIGQNSFIWTGSLNWTIVFIYIHT